MASTIELGCTYEDKLTGNRGVAIAHTEYIDATGTTVLLLVNGDEMQPFEIPNMRLKLIEEIAPVDLTDPDGE